MGLSQRISAQSSMTRSFGLNNLNISGTKEPISSLDIQMETEPKIICRGDDGPAYCCHAYTTDFSNYLLTKANSYTAAVDEQLIYFPCVTWCWGKLVPSSVPWSNTQLFVADGQMDSQKTWKTSCQGYLV